MLQVKKVKRTFILGEEWLYYKIYCGSYSSDNILVENILPIVTELKHKNLISHWFFIRYNDPKNHIRIRFHLMNSEAIQEVITTMQRSLSTLIEKDLVYDLAVGTYKREIERYGETTIEEVEKLFYYHSEKTLQLIDNCSVENDEIARIFASLHMMNHLMEECKLPLKQRQLFVLKMQLKFKEEQDIEKENNKKLDALYRNYRNDITQLLSEKKEPLFLEGINEILEVKKEETKILNTILSKITQEATMESVDLITSIIHMNINRTFRSKQRQYEMLCYDFMNRYYKSRIETI